MGWGEFVWGYPHVACSCCFRPLIVWGRSTARTQFEESRRPPEDRSRGTKAKGQWPTSNRSDGLRAVPQRQELYLRRRGGSGSPGGRRVEQFEGVLSADMVDIAPQAGRRVDAVRQRA